MSGADDGFVHGGRLIHRALDGDLVIEVVDTERTRALHFGTPARQSCTELHAPDALQLPYTRAMMSFLLLLPDVPSRVLLLGLGGGSIAKFLLRHFPACTIDAVEYSAEVARTAERFFALPRTDGRLRVHIGDATDFLDRRPQSLPYDAVLVDLFDAAGAAGCVAEERFVDQCRSALSSEGVLAMNLWRCRAGGYRQALAALGRGFGQRPLRLAVAARGNLIALVSNDPRATRRLRAMASRARIYEQQLQLDFSGYLRELRRDRYGWLHWLRS